MSKTIYDNMAVDPARADELVLVDGLDRQVGTATKEQTHREGLLHRAFSVVLVREGADGPEILLAQRAEGKYHSAGLWANSCCSHQRAGEEVVAAAYQRVCEELGCEAADLREVAAFAPLLPFSCDNHTSSAKRTAWSARYRGKLSTPPSYARFRKDRRTTRGNNMRFLFM